LRQAITLAHHGVPWDQALKMSNARRFGIWVAIGEEIHGETWNWDTMNWEERRNA
jgi:hypothetical protein